jgi:hypothetical protein
MMVGDVGSAPLDGPGASAHFPDVAALRTAVMGSKVHDDTMRDRASTNRAAGGLLTELLLRYARGEPDRRL